jgi:N-terminal domain of CBF1 interacting co-repressor CIR/Pre-mRNA splicing factor
MVQGLGFLSKKSWHTKNKANQEKVWIAEEQKKAEEAKTKELARQIQQEREEEEFAKISGKTTIKDRGIDWIYQGGTTGELAKQDAEKKQEEYLLGKEFTDDGAVKGDFDDGQQQPDGIHNVISKAAASTTTAAAAATSGIKPNGGTASSSYYGPASSTGVAAGAAAASSSHLEASVASRNEEFRMRMEDPMFLVSQKQHEKQAKHEKAKALYEKVVGPVNDKNIDNGDDDAGRDSSSESNDDRPLDHKRSKKSKKDRKRHKKHKKDKKKSSKRRRDHSRHSDENDDDNDDKSYDRDCEKKRRRRRSPSRSPRRKRSRSRSPSYERYRHKNRSDDDDYKHRRGGRESYSDDHGRRSTDEYRSSQDVGRHYDRDRSEEFFRRRERDERDSRHNQSRLKDPPKNSHDDVDGPKKIEGYGLMGATSGRNPVGTNDLGPSRELLQKKREERENERRRIHETASSRKWLSQDERKRALEDMQADARKRETQMDRQARHQKEDTTEDEFGRVRQGGASFLDDIHKQSHGISGAGSLSSRVAQNRHTQQRMHESFF